jgi:predicted SnoaL-like aldol condensation-catalyzing enzyme
MVELNKALGRAFYDLAFNECQPAEAIQSFAADEYVDLNRRFLGRQDMFIEYFDRLAREHPGKRVEFRHVIGQGQFVVLHCIYRWVNAPDCEGIDIFRVDDYGKIAQHWGFIERVPEPSRHASAMA